MARSYESNAGSSLWMTEIVDLWNVCLYPKTYPIQRIRLIQPRPSRKPTWFFRVCRSRVVDHRERKMFTLFIFTSVLTKRKCTSFSGRGLRSTKGCQVVKLIDRRRTPTGNPHFQTPRSWPLDHRRSLWDMKLLCEYTVRALPNEERFSFILKEPLEYRGFVAEFAWRGSLTMTD